MENPNLGETDLKTFNTAKEFVEHILFPLMYDFKKFQRQYNFGSDKLEDAIVLSEEIREINRYNGLKGMAETASDLLNSILSTIKVRNNKMEIAEINNIDASLEKIKKLFYYNKNLFFSSTYKGTSIIEVLDREYCEQVNKIIIVCYTNIEILMTKSRLLFADARDEYKSDAELMQEIKDEYVEY